MPRIIHGAAIGLAFPLSACDQVADSTGNEPDLSVYALQADLEALQVEVDELRAAQPLERTGECGETGWLEFRAPEFAAAPVILAAFVGWADEPDIVGGGRIERPADWYVFEPTEPAEIGYYAQIYLGGCAEGYSYRIVYQEG